MRRALAVTVLGLLALAPAAGGQEETTPILLDGTYAGGWAGERHQLWLRADPIGESRQLDVLGRVEASCGAGTFRGTVPAGPQGEIAAEGVTREGSTTTTRRLRGGVADGGRTGTGTLDATLEVRRGGRVRRCTTTARPWALAYGSSEHQLGGPPRPDSRWHGSLAGRGMTVAWVDPRRTRVKRLLVGFDLSFCPRRTPDRFWAVARDLPLEGDSFSAVRRFTVRDGSLRRRVRLQLSGTFFSDGLSTTVFIREITKRRGRVVSRCQAGDVGEDAEVLGPR